jgi:hypothetical protein
MTWQAALTSWLNTDLVQTPRISLCNCRYDVGKSALFWLLCLAVIDVRRTHMGSHPTSIRGQVCVTHVNSERLHAAVRTVVRHLGWQAIEHEEDTSWTLLWTDCSIPVDRVMRLRVSQVGLHVSILHHPTAGCWCGSAEAPLRLTSGGRVVCACP